MRMRIAGVLAAAVSLCASQSVFAADLPSRAPVYKAPVAAAGYNWTGFYFGGNAGYAWGDSDVSSAFSCPGGAGCSVSIDQNLANITSAATGSLSPTGFTGGVQAGYNWQFDATVFGLEADFNAFDLNSSRSVAVPSVTSSSIFNPTTTVDTNWLFTLRGRLGWTVAPTVLLYATGGLAMTDLQVSNSYTTANNPSNTASGASSHSFTRVGWTVGGGAEWALAGDWRVKAEYLYGDFGSISTSANVNNGTFAVNDVFQTSADLRSHIVRGGINYRF